jgi:hypothetical protein
LLRETTRLTGLLRETARLTALLRETAGLTRLLRETARLTALLRETAGLTALLRETAGLAALLRETAGLTALLRERGLSLTGESAGLLISGLATVSWLATVPWLAPVPGTAAGAGRHRGRVRVHRRGAGQELAWPLHLRLLRLPLLLLQLLGLGLSLGLGSLLDQVDVVLLLVLGDVGQDLRDLRLGLAGSPAGPLGQDGDPERAQQLVGPALRRHVVELGHSLIGLLSERRRLRLHSVHESHGRSTSTSVTWGELPNRRQE